MDNPRRSGCQAEEQRRIVAAMEQQLTRLDAGVASLRRVQDRLRRYKAAVLKVACEGRLVPQDPSDEPADALVRRILDERRAKWEAEQIARMQAQSRMILDDGWRAKYQEPQLLDTTGLPELPHGWVWVAMSQLLREPLCNGHSAKAIQGNSGVRTLTLTAVTIGDFSIENTKLTSADPERVKLTSRAS